MVRIVAGGDTITATNNHPFYLPQLGKYLRADSLRQNMKLLALTGALLTVHAVEAFDTTLQVYNFEVEEYHNYFVGEEGVLVHNDCIILIEVGLRSADGATDDVFDLVQDALAELSEVQIALGRMELRSLLREAPNQQELKAFFRGDDLPATMSVADRRVVQVDRVKAWEVLYSSSDDAIRALSTNTDWLTNISRWIGEKIDVVSLNGTVRLRNSTAEFGRLDASGRLFPTYFDKNWYPFTGYTAIGSPQNGCQVYKSPSGDFIVKRQPDLTGHDATYVNTYLTGSEKCHALERHNFDVSDEALRYRAQFGVAPDGSKTGWNYSQNSDGTWANIPTPPYSSKFASAQRMKDAIDATKPPVGHTGAWNPPKYSAPTGIPFGYGYPRANSAGVVPPAIDLTSVKVFWFNEGGNWKVLTMYPDIP